VPSLSENAEALLTVENLTVKTTRRAGKKTLIDDLSLIVRRGEILGVVGETGAGKTLLIATIMGELSPRTWVESGQATWKGETLNLHDRARVKARPGISVILSDGRRQLNPLVPVQRQIIDAVRAHHDLPDEEAMERARELLTMVQLGTLHERLKSYPHELSGGMAQRTFIAMSLASSPQLLFADEPTFGLDVTVQKQILDLITGLVRDRGMTLVIVTRDLGIVAHYTDRVAILRNGRIRELSQTKEFFRHPTDEYSRQLISAAEAAL
jgi:ABC-type dipeptide/oligopeptide/nickel transport system ATPase component